jgi:hypothetical protein
MQTSVRISTLALPIVLIGITFFLRDARMSGVLGDPLPTPVPIERAASSYNPTKLQRGVAVLLYRWNSNDAYNYEQYLDALFNRLVEDHVNVVSVNWPIYTDGVDASSVHAGVGTPSDDGIATFIEKARAHNLAVMLRPYLDETSIVRDGKNEWRGSIRPRDAVAWFKSYTDLMLQYAHIGEQHGAKLMSVGVELSSMEKYKGYWQALIGSVRRSFKGELTYSSNRGISRQMPWQALDFISVDAFFALDTPVDATANDMTKAWKPWVQKLSGQAAAISKPLVLAEIGSTSQQGAHRHSWRWKHGGAPIDLQDQRHYYAASCAAWRGAMSGMYWWAADITPIQNPITDTGFSPLGKPAEGEIVSCYKHET